MLSGLTEKEHVLKAKKLGASDFLSKPVQVDRLKRKVSHLVSTSGFRADENNNHGHQRLII
jgi:FixJ family two-component response regulator